MNSEEVMVKMIRDRWNSLLKIFDTTLENIPEERLQSEIAPGKNRGVYLLGHLTAVHDDMLPLLDLGNKLFPEWNKIFIDSPDKAQTEIPSIAQLKTSWRKVNDTLSEKFETVHAADWFQKHASVTAEDFVKEPYRNKLNILITRTSHLSYHTGQFVLLK